MLQKSVGQAMPNLQTLRHRGVDKEHLDLMKDLDNSAKIIGE